MLHCLSIALRPSPISQVFCDLPFPTWPQRLHLLSRCLTSFLKYTEKSFHFTTFFLLHFRVPKCDSSDGNVTDIAPHNLRDLSACARELWVRHCGVRVLVGGANLRLRDAALEGRGNVWRCTFIMRGHAFWGESVIRRRHKGRGKELEFSCTYLSGTFILSGHQRTSIWANTITIHWDLKVKCLQGPDKWGKWAWSACVRHWGVVETVLK